MEFDENLASTTKNSYYETKIDLGNNKKIIFYLWDTIGQEKFRELNEIFIKDSDCLVLG